MFWVVKLKTKDQAHEWWVASSDQEILDGRLLLSNFTPAVYGARNVAERVAAFVRDLGVECEVRNADLDVDL